MIKHIQKASLETSLLEHQNKIRKYTIYIFIINILSNVLYLIFCFVNKTPKYLVFIIPSTLLILYFFHNYLGYLKKEKQIQIQIKKK